MARILGKRFKNQQKYLIHPKAESAFDFFQSQRFLVSPTAFKADKLTKFCAGACLNLVELSPQNMGIFSGFESITFSLTNLNPNDYEIIQYSSSDIDDEEIEMRALNAVMRSTMSSISIHELESFRRDFNEQAPKQIIEQYFDKKPLTQNKWAELVSVSRSTLAAQNSKLQNDAFTSAEQSPTILASLLKSKGCDV
jgi:hypothetical protein